jgi:predicted ATPase/class 3 adenylate cyclase
MDAARADLPTGTVTFLRTDVEGSMRLARALGAGWDELNATQLGIVRGAVEARGGIAVRTEGDAVFAVFPEAVAAVLAAIDVQRGLSVHAWPDDAIVRARVGLHTGEAHLAGDDYGGFDVNRAARVAAVGHGGQIVLSDPTRALVDGELPAGATIRDLGRHALRDVPQPERLFQLDVPGLPTQFPPLRTGAASVGNLPPRLTSFVARDRELRELTDLLESARLVTITGPGGIGKTSLAIELARSLAVAAPDGTWIVPLDVVTDPAFVPSTIARTLAIYDGPGRPVMDGVVHFLADRRALLVLDNFEHVLEAAGAVATILRSAPMVRIIATSRSPLHVSGEQEYPLGTLGGGAGAGDPEDHAPGGPSAAARLFVERARAVQPGWEPGAEADVVEEICRLVDGLPLGIELAAARITLLPPSVIRDRLAARLPLPGSGPRDVPARQRTLDDTIAWSYELLEPGRRRLVRELAVFEGGFDLEQVRRVATLAPGEDALDALFELVDRSLIARSAISGHRSGLGSVRFRMLETIRTFALRELVADGTEPETRRRHAEAMLELAETAAPNMLTADQVRWLDRLAQDHANLASALRWAVDARAVDLAQRLSCATWRYWQLGGHLREGRALADAVIEMPGADEPSPARMWSFAAAGGLAYWQADTPRAGELYRAQLETAGQIGHRAGEADAWYNLSATEAITGNREEAAQFLHRARERYRELGDEIAFARTDWGVANMLLIEPGRELEGVELAEAARQNYAQTGDVMYEALAAGSLAFSYQALGRPVDALRTGIEAIGMWHAIRDIATSTIGLADGAILLLDFARDEEAATLVAAYHRLCDLHGVQPPAGLGQIIAWSRVEERAFQNLTSEEHAAAIRRGQAMSLDEAVAFIVATAEDVLRDLPAGGTGPAPEPA